MAETTQQYTERILSNAKGQDPVEIQSATGKKLAHFIEGVPDSQLRKRPAADKWSVSEILAHLADVEIATGWRIRSILGNPGTPVQAYDQNAWATVGNYEKRDPQKSVNAFRAVRDANLELLKALTPDQWKIFGQHAERGQESIERIVTMMAGHDINHIRQIENILSSRKA